jgi:predicted ATPase/DNA-binding winged helix-turn-helix (wHTH) protein
MVVAPLALPPARAPTDRTITFGRFKLYPRQRLLEENGEPLRLGSRAFELLLALLEQKGAILSKAELLERVWPDTNVEEGSLRVSIAAVKKALGQERSDASYIKNVPGKGYCFVAPIADSENIPLDSPTDSVRRGNIPTVPVRSIGRTEFIRSISAELPLNRFVTIVGPGGVGKTTVAIAAAQALRSGYEGRAYLVDLAPLQNSAHVLTTICSSLGLGAYSDNAIFGLASHLNDRRMLIVLDNCEHVIEAVAHAAEEILKAVPNLHILATSREPLRAEGESVRRLTPLKFPAASTELSPQEALAFPAVALFVDRATANSQSFTLNAASVRTICSICRQLDGIPLAIEFAAARIEELGLDGVSSRLDNRFALLTKGRRTALPRQRTLQGAMDWSYDLLPEAERTILRRLSLFAGSFPLDAAHAVAAFGAYSGSAIEDGVSNLVAKSLLSVDRDRDRDQYWMLETTREYVRSKLEASAERSTLAHRHAEHCLALLKQAAIDWDDGVTDRWLALYGHRLEDVRRAMNWAFSPDGDAALGVKLAAFSSVLWTPLALMNEHLSNIERALTANGRAEQPDRGSQMRLLASLGNTLFHTQGHLAGDRAITAFQGSFEAAMEMGDVPHQRRALSGLSGVHVLQGNYPAAIQLEPALEMLAGASDGHVLHRSLSHSRHFAGDFSKADFHLQQALRLTPGSRNFQNSGAQIDQRMVVLRATAAHQLWMTGDFDQAMTLAQQCVDDALAVDHAISLCHALAIGACPISLAIGGRAAAAPYLKLLRETSAKHSMALWLRWSDAYDLAMTSPDERRTPIFERMMTELSRAPMTPILLEHLASLGDGYSEEWMVLRAVNGFGGWCRPELLRAQGEMQLREGKGEAVSIALFREALALAQAQGGRAWALRAAASLARLLGAGGKRDEASAVLGAVQAGFTEGFDSVDFKRASALMVELC